MIVMIILLVVKGFLNSSNPLAGSQRHLTPNISNQMTPRIHHTHLSTPRPFLSQFKLISLLMPGTRTRTLSISIPTQNASHKIINSTPPDPDPRQRFFHCDFKPLIPFFPIFFHCDP